MGWWKALVKHWPLTLFAVSCGLLSLVLFLFSHSLVVAIGAVTLSVAYGSLFFFEYSITHTDDPDLDDTDDDDSPPVGG